jgi:O-antigen ligase
VRTFDDIDHVARVLVGGGAVVAVFALIEARTHFNVFNHLSLVIPGLRYIGADAGDLARGGHTRALASAQHPIPLSAMLVMLVPIGIYLAYTSRQRRWWAAVVVLTMAALATLSRTGVVMLLVAVIVFIVLRPGVMRRLVPYVPLGLVIVHFALPGTIGSFRDLFFPKGGLVAEQSQGSVGSSRGASFSVGMTVVSAHPVLGSGYATRITDDVNANAFIVDDQWLGTAMETGLVGVAVWVLLFFTAIRRMGREARRDHGSRGWFLTAIAASITAFAFGMATFDAFSFIQVTFVFYLLLALGSAAVRMPRESAPAVKLN